VEFLVLGAIEVVDAGRRLPVASGRQLSLLALLLVHANHVVSADRIIDELWGDEPPESGAKTVAFHVSRLRDALEPGRERGRPNGILATEPAGYVLRVDPACIDAVCAERLAAEGRALIAADPGVARTRLMEALALFRGRPFADVADEPFAQPEIRRLEELRLRATEDRVEADLALGRHADVIDELAALVAEQPLRERLRGQLMVALYRAGRQAEALRTCAEGRQVLADELGIEPGPELQQLEGWILRQDPRLAPPAPRHAIRNPYKGLRPFGEQDSDDFFGREALVGRLVERLGDVSRAGRFLAVVGPSGSGKSSVVRAGLIPAIRSGSLPGSERWSIAVMQPGARPLRELAAALRGVSASLAASPAADPASGLADRLDRDGDVGGAVAQVLADDGSQLVLVVDQLEELWSLDEDESERERFIAGLVGALSARDGRLLVVATLRADYLDRPLRSPGLGELVRDATELVTPLTHGELERAIVRPAASVGFAFEPGLAAQMITDVTRRPGELPLLQFALTELFEHGEDRRLTLDSYAAVGGVTGALGRRADAVYDSLDAEGREVARQVFLRLVTPGDPGEPVARRVPRPELDVLSDDRRRLAEVIDRFGRSRLLAFDRDPVSGEPIVQVAHEALLSRWGRLTGWIDDAREDLWTRRRLADAAADWIQAGRDPGFLLAGNRLDLLASWAATTDLRLAGPERELLDASLDQRRRLDDADAERVERERSMERRAAARLRALVAVLALAALVATSLSVAVYLQREAAREASLVATARELAAGSIGSLGADPQLSLLLALQAAEVTAARGYVVEEATDALNWALQESHVPFPGGEFPVAVRMWPGGARGVLLLEPNRLMALAAAAVHRGFSPEECHTYLHQDVCPEAPAGLGSSPIANTYTSTGVVPFEQLGSGSLAGTKVDVVAESGVDLTPLTAPLQDRTGATVELTPDTGALLAARLAAGDIPDAALVSRPADVAALARAGLLVDLAGIVDAPRPQSEAGDDLLSLGRVGPAGTWPSSDGGQFGIPVAIEVKSLVWYPRAAFERAGYVVPRTWADLQALTARIVADGRAPWCLGVQDAVAPGTSTADFVEDVVLHASGPSSYRAWTRGSYSFRSQIVRDAFAELGKLASQEDHVIGGIASAVRTPQDIAAWPMFDDPPGCWLHLAGGTVRGTWPAGSSGVLAAFPFPAADPAYANEVRGRILTLVVFHDRPEVRGLVKQLLGDEQAAGAVAELARRGLWLVGADDPGAALDGSTRAEGDLLRTALRSGSFRVSASDLMPARVAEAFAQGTVNALTWGQAGPILDDIQASWEDPG